MVSLTRQSGTHGDCRLKRRCGAQPRSRGRRAAAVASSGERIRLSDALALAAQPRGRERAIHDATLRGIMRRGQPDGSRFRVLWLGRDGKPRRVTTGTLTADQTRAAALAPLAREKRDGRTIPGRLSVQRLRVSTICAASPRAQPSPTTAIARIATDPRDRHLGLDRVAHRLPVADTLARHPPKRHSWLVPTIAQLKLAKWLTRERGEISLHSPWRGPAAWPRGPVARAPWRKEPGGRYPPPAGRRRCPRARDW